MTMRKERIYLGSVNFFDGNACDVLERLSNALDQVPEEHRGDASIDVYVYSQYDSVESEVEIYWFRPETPEEVAARCDNEAFRIRREEEEELAELARLKAKYESS